MKWLLTIVVVLVLWGGGYIGYLSALVDLDEQRFLEEVQAATDKERLEKQLARAKSILEARKRAYLRKSQEFLQSLKSRKKVQVKVSDGITAPVPNTGPSFLIPETSFETLEIPLDRFEQIQTEVADAEKTLPTNLHLDDQKNLTLLQEDKKDVDFFESEVAILEQQVGRASDPDVHSAMKKKKVRSSDPVRKVMQIADKRKELMFKAEQEKKQGFFWDASAKEIPSSIAVSVQSKDGIARTLQPSHSTQIATTLSIMPSGFEARVRSLYIVYGDQKMRRGMSGVGVVFMKGEEKDFFRVLVHEFGHAWDLHREVSDGEKSDFYDGQYRLFVEDPSVTYYKLTWKNTHERLHDLPAFTSSYGMTDPFEDYAEAFALYVLQGTTFRAWVNEHPSLSSKYIFFEDIFHQRRFNAVKAYAARPYDVTMMEVDYQILLND